MTSHELIYFDAAGRGEPTRIMLHIAGIDFKDTRVAFKDWPALKPTMPLGSMPILKIDGADHCQSMALARYAAKKAGYYPEDPLEALIVDEVMDTCNEIMSKAPRDPDADVMKKMRQDWQVGQLTQYANFIENKIQASGGKSVVKTPSVADIAVSAFVDAISSGTWDYIDADFFNQFPGMMAAGETIKNDPKVKAYYDSRNN